MTVICIKDRNEVLSESLKPLEAALQGHITLYLDGFRARVSAFVLFFVCVLIQTEHWSL